MATKPEDTSKKPTTKIDPQKVDQAKVDPKNESPEKADPKKEEPTQVDPKKEEPKKVDPPKAEKKNPYREVAVRYAKIYPENKVFHITTDMQVFLEKNKSAAVNHQKTLGEGQIQTINID